MLRIVDPVELLEDAALFSGWDADASIPDIDHDSSIMAVYAELDPPTAA